MHQDGQVKLGDMNVSKVAKKGIFKYLKFIIKKDY